MRKVIASGTKGYFHCWGKASMNDEYSYSVGIIEDVKTGRVFYCEPYNIRFVEEWPEDKK